MAVLDGPKSKSEYQKKIFQKNWHKMYTLNSLDHAKSHLGIQWLEDSSYQPLLNKLFRELAS